MHTKLKAAGLSFLQKWLPEDVLNSVIHLETHSTHRSDQTSESFTKSILKHNAVPTLLESATDPQTVSKKVKIKKHIYNQ